MRGGLLRQPGFTGAVAVLAVNDHVLKPAFGGWWTGKISDFAGVFVVAVLVGTVTAAPRLSVVVVGVGFTALKLVPGVAELGAPVLGGMTRRDPTDLVALAALVPALAFLGSGGRGGSLAGGRVLLAGSGVVAVLATTATSCESSMQVGGLAIQEDGSVATRLSHPSLSEGFWAASSDGGATWTWLSVDPTVIPDSEPMACSDERGCFRVAGRAVEHRAGDSQQWDTSFAFTAEQERRLSHRRGCGVPDEFTAVAVVPRPDGDHVVVAMGGQGVLHLPPGGAWERRAVMYAEPIRLDGPSWLAHGRPLPLAVLLVSIVLFVLAGTRKRVERAAMVVLIGGVCSFMVSGALVLAGVDYTIAGPLVAGLSVAVFAASLAPFLWTRVRRATREARQGS